VGDVDADGDQDVVLAGVGALGGTAVVFNDGKGNFKTGPRLADKTVVPCLGDIDNDGCLDLWLGRAGRDLLLLGDGKGQVHPGARSARTRRRAPDHLRAAGRSGQRWRP
ncbi:MAG: FG-GAP repeat domain-containing protein, partial [Isosphaeraceae bacterium]